MMNTKIIIYILVAFGTSLLIRLSPLVWIKKPIKNKFIRSFLYYVPYVTLAVMTFPSILSATSVPAAGLCAFIVGILLAYFDQPLPIVAGACCITVLITELFL